jgi:hypothetical protein
MLLFAAFVVLGAFGRFRVGMRFWSLEPTMKGLTSEEDDLKQEVNFLKKIAVVPEFFDPLPSVF